MHTLTHTYTHSCQEVKHSNGDETPAPVQMAREKHQPLLFVRCYIKTLAQQNGLFQGGTTVVRDYLLFIMGKSMKVIENINQRCEEWSGYIHGILSAARKCFNCCGMAESSPMETLGFLSLFVPLQQFVYFTHQNSKAGSIDVRRRRKKKVLGYQQCSLCSEQSPSELLHSTQTFNVIDRPYKTSCNSRV